MGRRRKGSRVCQERQAPPPAPRPRPRAPSRSRGCTSPYGGGQQEVSAAGSASRDGDDAAPRPTESHGDPRPPGPSRSGPLTVAVDVTLLAPSPPQGLMPRRGLEAPGGRTPPGVRLATTAGGAVPSTCGAGRYRLVDHGGAPRIDNAGLKGGAGRPPATVRTGFSMPSHRRCVADQPLAPAVGRGAHHGVPGHLTVRSARPPAPCAAAASWRWPGAQETRNSQCDQERERATT